MCLNENFIFNIMCIILFNLFFYLLFKSQISVLYNKMLLLFMSFSESLLTFFFENFEFVEIRIIYYFQSIIHRHTVTRASRCYTEM